jgi:hypothetical protein
VPAKASYTGRMLGYAIDFEIPNWVMITAAALAIGAVIAVVVIIFKRR